MNTSEDPSNPLLQVLLSLSTDTIKGVFNHFGGNISELSDQNKYTVMAEIVRKWRQIILGRGARVLWKHNVP